MPKTIALFSSNKRKLYEEDVLKALSLPNGYVLQFRYNARWVHPDILAAPADYHFSEGIIFFAYYSEGNSEPENISVRHVRIKTISYELDTELYIFLLELGDFVDASPNPAKSNLLPPNLSVSLIDIIRQNNTSWINRVDALNNKLTAKTFFQIKEIYSVLSAVEIEYSEFERESFYKLDDESEYFMVANYAEYAEEHHSYKYSCDQSRIFLNLPNEFKLGALKDSKRHSFVTLASSREKQFTFIKVSVPEVEISIKVRIDKNKYRSAGFAVFFTIGALALVAAQGVSKKLADNVNPADVTPILSILTIVMVVMAYKLYSMFDKK